MAVGEKTMTQPPTPTQKQTQGASSSTPPQTSVPKSRHPQVWEGKEQKRRESPRVTVTSSLTGEGMKHSAVADGVVRTLPSPSPALSRHPTKGAPAPFPFPAQEKGLNGWSRATHRVLEFLIVFSVIGPRPPFFFCNGTILQSGGAN